MKFATSIIAANLLSIISVIAATIMILRGIPALAWGWFLLLAFMAGHTAPGKD